MSMNNVANLYEKMLQNPKNRQSSQGKVKQPSPYSDMGMADPNESIEDKGILPEDLAMMSAVDKRMAKRASGEIKDIPVGNNRLEKLEKDVNELKELVTEMMKVHIKLLNK